MTPTHTKMFATPLNCVQLQQHAGTGQLAANRLTSSASASGGLQAAGESLARQAGTNTVLASRGSFQFRDANEVQHGPLSSCHAPAVPLTAQPL